MAVPKTTATRCIGMAVYRQDMLYKDYTSNPIPTSHYLCAWVEKRCKQLSSGSSCGHCSGRYFPALETVTQLQGLVPFGVQHELCKTHTRSVMDSSQSLAYVCLVLSSKMNRIVVNSWLAIPLDIKHIERPDNIILNICINFEFVSTFHQL